MAKMDAHGRTHLAENFASCGLPQRGFVRHQRDGNAVHEFEQCHNHFFFYTYRLSPMGLLPLYEWSKVMNQPVESLSPHAQYVVEHVGCIDVEEVLLKPTRGSGFDIPSCIQHLGMLG